MAEPEDFNLFSMSFQLDENADILPDTLQVKWEKMEESEPEEEWTDINLSKHRIIELRSPNLQ